MIKIKPANSSDIKSLNQFLPTNIPNFHEQKIKEQEIGNSLWLVAWKDRTPVGHLQLRWGGANIEKVRSILGEIPHIESVGVKEDYRRQGVGTQLTIRAIEIVKQKGYKLVGLAVGSTDNPYARKMYEKLGFKDWGKGEIVDSWEIENIKGRKEIVKEVCIYLTKELS